MLLLIAIKHAVHHKQYRITFSEIEQDLKYLLQKYGLPRTVIHPEHPFWRLRNDGFWIVENAHQLAENSAGDVGRNQLIQKEIRAGFTEEFLDQLLNGSRYTYKDLVLSLLDQYFPESLHSDLLNDIGIRFLYKSETWKRKRDPAFREKVLHTYDYKCAVCDYDLRFYNDLLGLEAAHIKWHKSGGPDTEQNGIALCTLHHKLLDLGAMAISHTYEILLSNQIDGSAETLRNITRHSDKKINEPLHRDHLPKAEYLDWHHREVFKSDC